MLKKKILIISINIIVLSALLYIQEMRYDSLSNLNFQKVEHGEILLKVDLMKQSGIDVNWLTGICVGLLILNCFIYRQIIKAKRWILEPILIFTLSLGLTITYHINRTFVINERLFERKEN
jgi:hypothetical protein